ncbi:ubiquitin fusion degradation protein UFD1 [Teladorsagia circumcincta]|uniref:Ubiquitin fusion degradation protein UFD1 n=1 Tax=Teladorsagia circumcincta TaxID=45464 RepID=A0A2G9UCQ8_TELCI|nr:ubiquitin fusion degradation protein UFD1 [Teladorsagia circumcincta]
MMNILSGMMGMGGGYSGRYSCQMRAYSAAFIDADSAKVVELNYGGKMMKQLRIDEGAEVRVDSVTLQSATYAKLKPQSLEFLNISNPRAVLEVELRKFACLTKNDVIAVLYADQVLEFLVQEVKPSNAVCIIECDLNLDFDAPEGYVEQPRVPKPAAGFKVASSSGCEDDAAPSGSHFSAFSGSGQRLDGKKKPSSSSLCTEQADDLLDTLQSLPPVVCVEDYKPGKLSFIRYDYKSRFDTERELQEAKVAAAKKATPFEGSSATIRKRY